MSNYHTTYAEFLGISAIEFHKLNVLNPTIYTDVRLFIDPRLLKHSQYDIFSNIANTTFENYYKNLADCIRAYLIEKDSLMQLKMKREIIKKLTAHEPIGLGLGYSKNSIAGQGIGHSNATILFKNAVELYKRIPSIGESAFSLINLLSEGIGADYIGDITANIIIKELYTFTEHIAKELGIKTELFRLGTNMYSLPIHPNSKRKVFPILLVPKDILSDLPRDVDLVYRSGFNPTKTYCIIKE